MGKLEVMYKDGKLTVTAPAAMEIEMDTDLENSIVRI